MINGVVKQAASEREAPKGWTRLAKYLASIRVIGRPALDLTGLTGVHGFEERPSTN